MIPPDAVVVIAELPVGIIMGNRSPATSFFEQVKHAVEHLAQVRMTGRGLLAGRPQKGFYNFKLLAGEIARIENFWFGGIAHHGDTTPILNNFKQVLRNVFMAMGNSFVGRQERTRSLGGRSHGDGIDIESQAVRIGGDCVDRQVGDARNAWKTGEAVWVHSSEGSEIAAVAPGSDGW